MNTRTSKFGLIVATVLAGAGLAQAAVATIPPVRDNTLFESDPSASCASGPLFCGKTSFAGSRRALVVFDVAGNIPAGSTINGVTLRMDVIRTGFGGSATDTYSLHRLLQSWGESDSSCAAGTGAPAGSGDATWSHRLYATDAWTTPGGDYNAVASGSAPMPTLGTASFTSQPGMVSNVQSWLDSPAGNFGWIIIGQESIPQSAREIDSREGAKPPSLEVDFNPPAGPPEIPDGRLAPPLRLARLTPDGSSLRVEWNTSLCTGNPGNHLVFGTRSDFPVVPGGTYGVSGTVCAMGATSPFIWNGSPDPAVLDPSRRLLWVLVLADDASATEGSWGRNSAHQERNGPGANGCSNQCGMTNKSLSNTCGQMP